MAFTTITAEEIEVGEPTAKQLFEKIKDNLDDHESRIGAAETGLTARPPISFGVFGVLQNTFAKDEMLIERVPVALTLTAARLFIKTAGTSGTTTIDVEYKRGAGAWTSILTSVISSPYTDGDYFTATGTLAETSLLPGDLLRLNVDSVQVDMEDFVVYIENEVA